MDFETVRPRVRMNNISKRFGDVQALDKVDFRLGYGEVHVLFGENGAGKTSLMNVLSGLYQADAGEIYIGEEKTTITCPKDAIENNIGMVHQHFELIPKFTAIENIILGNEGRAPILDVNRHRSEINDLMVNFGLKIDLNAKVKDLAIGLQQKVEILKALYREASILVLDEPTTMLTPQEVNNLFSVIHKLVEEGLSVVFISHKIKEVLTVSDRITVMREGKYIKTVSSDKATERSLVELMIGEEFSKVNINLDRNTQKDLKGNLFCVNNMCIRDDSGNWLAHDVSIKGNAGEILGLVGVSGNGQREVAEAIYGLRELAKGNIEILDCDVTKTNIRRRLDLGVSLIPEDRVGQGILPQRSVAETLILGPHHFLFSDALLYNRERVRSIAKEIIKDFGIVAPSEDAPTCLLSGGNIQKVVVARAFVLAELVDPNLLIAFSPTGGLDFKSTMFVRRKLIDFRDRLGCVLLISEDLDESLTICDRIYVIHNGEIVGEFDRNEFDAYKIGALMTGGGE